MTFEISNWDSVGSQPNSTGLSPGVFRYGTLDALNAALTPGYFDSVKDQLKICDQIYVSATAINPCQWAYVTQVTPTVIVSLNNPLYFLPEGALWVGNSGDQNTAIDFSVAGSVPIGNGITTALGRIQDDSVANSVIGSSNAAVQVLYRTITPGGAATTTVSTTHAMLVCDVWIVVQGAGTADTITVNSATTAFTNAMSINVSLGDVVRVSNLLSGSWVIPVGTQYQVVQTGGPACDVFLSGVRF